MPMDEINDQIESDVNQEASSELPNESESQEGEELGAQANDSKETTTNEPSEQPFHEHPRFRELVEQKNKYAEQARALEEKYSQLASQLDAMKQQSKPKEEEDELIKELTAIRPEFGKRFGEMAKKMALVDELLKGQEDLRQQTFAQSATQQVKALHEQYKVPAELRDRYFKEMDTAYRMGAIRSMDDVNRVYKQVHEDYTKFVDSIKRAERGSYVADKKADAKLPSSQPKGKNVDAGKGPKFSSDPFEARQQLIQRVLQGSKADTDLG